MAPPIRSTLLVLLLAHFLLFCDAFVPPTIARPRIASPPPSSRRAAAASDEDSFPDALTRGWERFQQAKAEGYDFKQSVAVAIAGDYDAADVRATIQGHVDAASCVLFTWENSPACKKAIQYLDVAGAKYTVVRLDDPWSEGNSLRAELGKMVGRSSVPCIFVGGEYVGGFDGGTGKDSPGILEMAFRGTLREKLTAVGALD